MKKLFYLLAMVFATTLFTSCEKVDAGHEGILVNLYGIIDSTLGVLTGKTDEAMAVWGIPDIIIT
jgi:hypothetical protein